MVHPLAPVRLGPSHALLGLAEGPRRWRPRPGQGDEPFLPLAQGGLGVGPRSLEAHPQVRGEAQNDVPPLGARLRPAVPLAQVPPPGRTPSVVRGRLAVHRELDVAVHAADRAEQDVLGLVIGGRSLVLHRPLDVVVPGADQERVAHDQPAGPGLPGRLQDQGARDVPTGRGHRELGRPHAEVPGGPVQDRGEHARAVGPGHAEPLHVARGRHERAHLTIRQERVVGDWGERAVAGTLQTHPRILARSCGGATRRRPPPGARRGPGRSRAPRRPTRPGGTRSPRAPARGRRPGPPRSASAG